MAFARSGVAKWQTCFRHKSSVLSQFG